MSTGRRVRARWRLIRHMGVRSGSLRSQLAVVIATVGLLAIVLNAVLISVFLNGYLQTQQGQQMAVQAQHLGGCCRYAKIGLLLEHPRVLDELMQTALAGTPSRRAIIVDARGRQLYVSPTADGSPLSRSTLQMLLTHLRHDLTAPAPPHQYAIVGDQIVSDVRLSYSSSARPLSVGAGGQTIGWLMLAEDLKVVNQRWRATVLLAVGSGIAAIVLAVLAGLFATREVTRPIRNVTAAARGIAGGDYARRVPPAGPAELRELSVAFNAMVDEVVHQRRIERDLLANVSHELAAPLGLIGGYAEALADGMIGGEDQRQAALHAISAEATRLGRLSGDLLDLALLETGQVRVNPEPVPVADLLAGLRERFTPVARNAGITLGLDVPSGLPLLVTDGLRLEQVLVNLINNALRHTPHGGSVTLRAARQGAELRLEVADTGSGIPAEDLTRIWERFYQVDKGRDRRAGEAGVGLGLAICRSTITLLGGRIGATSAVGRGTTFTIYLPLRRDEKNGARPNISPPRTLAGEVASPSR